MNKQQHQELIASVAPIATMSLSYSTRIKPSERQRINGSRESAEILRPLFLDTIEHHEVMYAMMLDRSNKLMGVYHVSTGGLSGTVCDPAQVYQAAILANAAGIVLAHSHPSGNVTPSQSDIVLTKRFKEIGVMLERPLLDHVIMAPEGKYLSFADEGLL